MAVVAGLILYLQIGGGVGGANVFSGGFGGGGGSGGGSTPNAGSLGGSPGNGAAGGAGGTSFLIGGGPINGMIASNAGLDGGVTLSYTKGPTVPTMSQWGLIVLALVLVIFGLVAVRGPILAVVLKD